MPPCTPTIPSLSLLRAPSDFVRTLQYTPYRTELCLAHFGLVCCGQIDALFRHNDGTFAVVDWKRTRKLEFENSFRRLLPPLEHMTDCNGVAYPPTYNTLAQAMRAYSAPPLAWYNLQLNLYRYMLESEYQGFCIEERMFLAVVHPDLSAPRLIRVPYMQEEMLLIVEDQIWQRKAVSFAQPGPDAQFRLPNGEL